MGEEATDDYQDGWDPVLRLVDYYDGWRLGIAHFCGVPHVFRSEWTEKEGRFLLYGLWPVSDDRAGLLVRMTREVEAMAEAARDGASNSDQWSAAWDKLIAAFAQHTVGHAPIAERYGEFGSEQKTVRWHEFIGD